MFIYKTTNLINNKIYIGFHSKNDNNYLGSGIIFLKSIKKYGKENFKREIIEYVNENNWQERERFWIKELNSQNRNIGYNITNGGEGILGFTFSEESKKKNVIICKK